MASHLVDHLLCEAARGERDGSASFKHGVGFCAWAVEPPPMQMRTRTSQMTPGTGESGREMLSRLAAKCSLGTRLRQSRTSWRPVALRHRDALRHRAEPRAITIAACCTRLGHRCSLTAESTRQADVAASLASQSLERRGKARRARASSRIRGEVAGTAWRRLNRAGWALETSRTRRALLFAAEPHR